MALPGDVVLQVSVTRVGPTLIVKLNGGHHFDGDYANLARQILAAANPANAAR